MFKKLPFLQDDNVTPPASGGTPPPATPPATPPAAAWYDEFQNPDVKDWVKSYGNAYPNPEAMASKAFQLEKFVGAEKAGRGVIVPKSDAKPEEWKAFYSKSGLVPEKLEGYTIPDTVAKHPVLSKDPLVQKFAEKAHADGVPLPIFKSQLEWYTNMVTEAEAKQTAEYVAKADADVMALKTQWPGIEYDKNIELGRRAAAAFLPGKDKAGIADFITTMEGAVGTKATFEFFANIGKGMSEHNFVSGDGTGGMGGGMTPEAARVRIDVLKKDGDWQKKFLAGGADEKAEWDKLNRVAYTPSA